MYATKPLSVFKSHPEAGSTLPPPEGGSSGYLVVKSIEDGADAKRWWGCCGETRVRELPFPQNRIITVRDPAQGEYAETYADAVVFVPVPSVPLASNRYYAVLAGGKHRGLVRPCSREEDMATLCFCRCVRDAKPRPFDPEDVYQQMEIVPHNGSFTARAVAADGHPYTLYRGKYWQAYASKPKHFDITEALGLNGPLRSHQLQAQTLMTLSAAAVGRWYCPFCSIKEDGVPLKKQMDRAAFYEVVLEQRWEDVAAVQASKMVLVGGSHEGKQEGASSRHGDDGYVWFRAAAGPAGQRVGVSASMWEKMLWVEHRGGWADEEEDVEKKTAGGVSVLVERFAVKRMDDSVAMAFDFVHLNKVVRAN